jgi:membrane protease YdiL (CAAX protease family)
VIIGLFILANFGELNRTARTVSLIIAGTLAGLELLIGLYAALNHLVQYSAGLESPAAFRGFELTALPLAAAGALSLLYLWPPVQRGVARLISAPPGSPVMYLTVVLGLLLIAQQLGSQIEQQPPLTYTDLLAQDIPLFILAFVGVGLFVRRTPRQAVERLGLLPPRQAWWWLVAVAGVGVFLAVAFGIEAVANVVAPDQQKRVTDVSTVLFSHFNNPAAVIFLGVMAAVVEETLFRGALVPRLGVIVTSVLFAALHTQYALSFATLEVFVLGVGLGWLRLQAGTLPCIVTHAGYDIAVGLIPLVFK